MRRALYALLALSDRGYCCRYVRYRFKKVLHPETSPPLFAFGAVTAVLCSAYSCTQQYINTCVWRFRFHVFDVLISLTILEAV